MFYKQFNESTICVLKRY